MSAKKPSQKRQNKSSRQATKQSGVKIHPAAFDKAFNKKRYQEALKIAEQLVEAKPNDPASWEALANVLGRLDRMGEAAEAMQNAIHKMPIEDPKAVLKYAQYTLLAGHAESAANSLREIIVQDPTHVVALTWLTRAYFALGKNKEALETSERALSIDESFVEALVWKSRVLDELKRPSEAVSTLKKLQQIEPQRVGVSNHLASIALREGDYEKAEACFKEELSLDPSNGQVLSNIYVARHYNPNYSPQELSKLATEWQQKHTNTSPFGRAKTQTVPHKRLRIGLLSGGFRIHPVGQMILPALQHLEAHQFELLVYSTHQASDKLTDQIQAATHQWYNIAGLNTEELDQKIREDQVDILIDMNGAGEGSRYLAISREPAPLIIKWVGSLINTTGLSCMDYLISDSIETPAGVDKLYTEKLIRMPDDYICYHIPEHAPKVTGLPALKNGYITFGCLNNPAKLSPPLMKEWSALLKEVPSSKLLLRGVQFEGQAFCEKITNIFASHGIESNRLILEGPADHHNFMATYQRIDIALDTWPYSGGLTTCEALLMGVPVVTHTGPTFAGRHTATHLANAGLQELITDNWNDFRRRAKELAGDLPNLAVIRAALRTILTESPVCNGPRFGKNLTVALRAIWQRHCEGKAPETLTFNKDSEAWFADEEKLVELVEVDAGNADFEWNLENQITVIDHGSVFARHPNFSDWMETGNFAVITFDPGSLLTKQVKELKKLGEWHHYPHALLGNGQDATLYATLEPEFTGTLKPMAAEKLSGEWQQRLEVLTKLPINTIKLNDIEGLPSVDLMVLDNLNDVLAVLENGSKYIKETLIIQIRIAFQSTHKRQPNFSDLQHWADMNGFRLYSLNNLEYYSHFPGKVEVEQCLGSELVSADMLLLPNSERLQSFSKNQCICLAFLLNQIYNIHDISYLLLQKIDQLMADRYLQKFVTTSAPLQKTRKENVVRPEDNDHNAEISGSFLSASREVAVSDLKVALGSRKMVFVSTGSMANHGIVQTGQKRLFNILKEAGCPVDFMDANEATPRKLMQMATSGDHVIYGANRYYDMSVNISGYGNHNVFQAFQNPVIGTINDHPYSNFMLDRIAKAPSKGLFLTRKSFSEELAFMRPDLKYLFCTQVETASKPYSDCYRPHSERDIDILVPMNIAYALNVDKLHANLMVIADEYGRGYRKLVDRVLNQYNDFSHSLLFAFRKIYKKIFQREWVIQIPWSQEDKKLLRLIGHLDDVIRANKRLEALKVISCFNPSARVVILAPVTMQEMLYRKMDTPSVLNWQFIGIQPFEELEKLYTRSRYVLNVFPTYHDWLHERVRGAAAAGCVLITNRNERAAQLFTHGKNVLFYEENETDALYSENANVSESIGTAGRTLLEEKLLKGEDGIDRTFSACATYLKQFNAEIDEDTSTVQDSATITLPSAPHMSDNERKLFKKALGEAKSYFEFGSGGSTVWAVQNGLVVNGVESDKSWVDALKKKLGDKCKLEFVDIGPTGDWGVPTSNRFAERFDNYSHSILDANELFDLVLVDGRFRVACTLAAILHILNNSNSPDEHRIFIHDFWNRPIYHVVLEFLDPVEKVDTAGVFVVKSGISSETVKSVYHRYKRDVS